MKTPISIYKEWGLVFKYLSFLNSPVAVDAPYWKAFGKASTEVGPHCKRNPFFTSAMAVTVRNFAERVAANAECYTFAWGCHRVASYGREIERR